MQRFMVRCMILCIITAFFPLIDQKQALATESGSVQSPTAQASAVASADWLMAAQNALVDQEYSITWVAERGYQAPNRANNLRAFFGAYGVQVTPRMFSSVAAPWHLAIALQSAGSATLEHAADAHSIVYQHSDAVERYSNSERGLTQQLILSRAPSADPAAATINLKTNLTPTLNGSNQSIALSSAAGVHVLDYTIRSIYDAEGQALPVQLRLAGAASSPTLRLALPTTARYPLTVEALISTPDWSIEGTQQDTRLGTAVDTAGDVNGDGYSDVIIGAPLYDAGAGDEGRVLVFYGSASGLASTPDWLSDGSVPMGQFGYSVGTAGDVNGDGYSDVIIGAPMIGSPDSTGGAAEIYYGSADGLSAEPDWSLGNQLGLSLAGYSVGTAGDVNGDGYSDVIISLAVTTQPGRVGVYYGSSAGLGASPDWSAVGLNVNDGFGYSVGTAGDVNGDGYSDVIIGAPYRDNGGSIQAGHVDVYYGSAQGLLAQPAWSVTGATGDTWLGYAVSTAGDVNGDGYSDVIVGAPHDGATDQGQALIYFGGALGLSTTPDWSVTDSQPNAQIGQSIGTVGDVNGDGYSDVIVGAPVTAIPPYGVARIYYGGHMGVAEAPISTIVSDERLIGPAMSIGTAGDVNGDGYSDIIIGRPFANGTTEVQVGRAAVYLGGPRALSEAAVWSVESAQQSAQLGTVVATAGDVNGDGYSDVIIGAPFYDAGAGDEGRVLVFYGSASGLASTPDWLIDGSVPMAQFGYSVASAGDVNGDGYSDVIIGAPVYLSGQSVGHVEVYVGSAAGLASTPAWSATSDQGLTALGWSVGTAGDVNGDGYSDVIIGAPEYQDQRGRIEVYYGTAGTLANTPTWSAVGAHSGAQLGSSVGTAGDVNGDGYSDVIAGALGYSQDQAEEGQVLLYYGSTSGLESTAAWSFESDQANAQLGWSVGTAGDVNGDGYSDVIVGIGRYDTPSNDAGRAQVFYGAASGLSSMANWTIDGDQSAALFGIAVGTVGDVNGDGYSDVIIGAPQYASELAGAGRATLYLGAASGLAVAPSWAITGTQAGAVLGTAVGTAGDVNGDGYSDVLVSAVGYSNAQTFAGQVQLFYGNAAAGRAVRPQQLKPNGQTPIAPLGLTTAMDAFQLRVLAHTPLGRAPVRLEWQVAPLGSAFDAPAAHSGVGPWTDVLTTGVALTQPITGLLSDTPYHWRVRLRYQAGSVLGQTASRWVHLPWNGWRETDLRTAATPPLAPEANAGPDQTVSALTLVTLDGSASSDAGGNLPLTYQWTQSGGPAVTLSDATAVQPTFVAPATSSVLTFTLAVTNSLGLAAPAPDTVIVTVNAAPAPTYRFYLPFMQTP